MRLNIKLLFDPKSSRSRVGAAGRGHGPIVFCDTRPEYPNRHDGAESEQSLEQGAVDFAACAVADVRADNVLEDLAEGEKHGGCEEVDW